MDNRITKSRISNFFAYEWIAFIAIAVAGILLWELVYTIASVRLTTGQYFKYYYDDTIYAMSPSNLDTRLYDDGTYSYDVLNWGYETLSSDYNVLTTRLSIQEGDAIFTDIAPDEVEEGSYVTNRANELIDNCSVYSMEDLLKDAKAYLSGFLKDGIAVDEVTDSDAMLDYANLDGEKIAANFLTRMRKDNRYRTDDEKAAGIISEKERIEKLCVDVTFFQSVLEYDGAQSVENSLFYSYRMYDQTIATLEKDKDKENYEQAQENKTVQRYGLKMEKLTGGELDVRNYMRLNTSDATDSSNVVLLVFNFKEQQPDLQYETVSFVSQIIRLFSNINID